MHEFALLKLRDKTPRVCGLITKRDKDLPDLAGIESLYTGPQFFELIRRLDMQHCCLRSRR